jgi:dolichyl-phosphate beta-glucosyltransferase
VIGEHAGRPFLTVVIPAYNEERRLPATLSRIAAYLEKAGLTEEILVVDDGSSDATARLAADSLRGRRGRVLRNGENRGKGHSVRRGVLEAAGRWVLLTDADLSAPIEEYSALAEAVRERDLDMAIGSRALAGSRVEVPQNLVRQTMGKTFNRIIRLMTGLSYHDTQCGFKLMDRDRVRPLFEKMVVDRFAFDVELLYLCMRFGLKVREVPVVWRNSPASRVGLVGDPFNMIFDVARVRWRFRRGLYNPEVPPPRHAAGGGAA